MTINVTISTTKLKFSSSLITSRHKQNKNKMNMKKTIITILLALVSLASCSSDPQWADEEAHEKTEQLRKQYTPIIAGTWHVEYIKDKGRFFERLTFSADGTFTGMRKWQTRKLVTIDDKEQYTA